MKSTDQNIIMITAGGVGHRFGSAIPKQYVLLNGRTVLSYVVEACKKSKKADAIVIVADPSYHEELVREYGVDVAISGKELNITKRNGFDYIQSYSSCKKLIVVEGVRPTLDPKIIDRFFDKLDEYDVVTCARKITDSLGHMNEWIINREEYYTMNPPQGFRFSLLSQHFQADSQCTESIQQLPSTTRVYRDFDVPYFDKVTYPEDLNRIAAMLTNK